MVPTSPNLSTEQSAEMETGPEPYFDIVDVEMPREDFWAQLVALVGIRLTRMVPQTKWRPGGFERMCRDQAEFAQHIAAWRSQELQRLGHCRCTCHGFDPLNRALGGWMN